MNIGVTIESMPSTYYLNKNGVKSVALSHVNTADLDQGNNLIKMGAHLEEYGNVLPVLMMMCEEDCERRITHETIHIVLYQLEDEKTTDLFDVIDADEEITGCGFEKPDLKVWLDKYKYPITTYDELVKYLEEQMNEHYKEKMVVILDYLFMKRELKEVD